MNWRKKAVSDIPIIYEDNHLLVVVKPPNMLSQGDRTGDLDLLSILKQDLKIRYQKPGNVYLALIHRLDRPVGGLMVFAKTSKAAGRLNKQFQKRSLGKTYLAVVHGKLAKPSARLVHYLRKDQRTNLVTCSETPIPGGKEGILSYQVLAEAAECSLVEVQLYTGRSHQIRTQLAAIGHPILGDHRYGRQEPGVSIALWAYQLEFIHPTTKEKLVFKRLPEAKYPWNLFEHCLNS
ncbi:MAG: RNA pseudouridine synthase [Firmicutes bacterium]|nr:RNA pseudouridine synthase [Bacillota bacterium]